MKKYINLVIDFVRNNYTDYIYKGDFNRDTHTILDRYYNGYPNVDEDKLKILHNKFLSCRLQIQGVLAIIQVMEFLLFKLRIEKENYDKHIRLIHHLQNNILPLFKDLTPIDYSLRYIDEPEFVYNVPFSNENDRKLFFYKHLSKERIEELRATTAEIYLPTDAYKYIVNCLFLFNKEYSNTNYELQGIVYLLKRYLHYSILNEEMYSLSFKSPEIDNDKYVNEFIKGEIIEEEGVKEEILIKQKMRQNLKYI